MRTRPSWRSVAVWSPRALPSVPADVNEPPAVAELGTGAGVGVGFGGGLVPLLTGATAVLLAGALFEPPLQPATASTTPTLESAATHLSLTALFLPIRRCPTRPRASPLLLGRAGAVPQVDPG